MWLCDGPGTGSTKVVFKHSAVIRYGLRYEPLNTIFVAVPYHDRIEKIIDILKETVSCLKKVDLPMVCVIITMFNFFVPDAEYTEERMRGEITEDIKEAFMEMDQESIKHVMFDRGDVDPPAEQAAIMT